MTAENVKQTLLIGAKQSTLSILCSTVLTANLKVGKQVGFGDAIRAPDFHRRDFAFVQQLVPRFGADSQGIAHLLDVHHIGILAQHHTVGIALVKSFAAYTKHLFFENLRMLHFSKSGENWLYSSSTALLSPFFAPKRASLNAPISISLHFFTDFLASVATVCTYGVLFDTQFGSRVGHR